MSDLLFWRRRSEKAEAERDEAQAHLKNLLAVFHRDGGHYTEQHGLEKAVQDAHLVWADLMTKAEQHDEALAQVAILSQLVKIPHDFPAAAKEMVEETKMTEALVQRQAGLLTGVVNAIRGEPDEKCLHSHHDAPELVKVMAEKARNWDETPTYKDTSGTLRCHWKDCDKEAQPEGTATFWLSSFCNLHKEDSKDIHRVKAAWAESKKSRKELRGVIATYQDVLHPVMKKENARLREALTGAYEILVKFGLELNPDEWPDGDVILKDIRDALSPAESD